MGIMTPQTGHAHRRSMHERVLSQSRFMAFQTHGRVITAQIQLGGIGVAFTTVVIRKRLMHEEFPPGSQHERFRIAFQREIRVRHAVKEEAEQIVMLLDTATQPGDCNDETEAEQSRPPTHTRRLCFGRAGPIIGQLPSFPSSGEDGGGSGRSSVSVLVFPSSRIPDAIGDNTEEIS